MPELLIIGAPGVGKSSAGKELPVGQHFLDIDDARGILVDPNGVPLIPGQLSPDLAISDVLWDPEAMAAKIATERASHETIRFAGIASNFYDPAIAGLFSGIKYLRARPGTIRDRLSDTNRQNNFDFFGGRPERVERLIEILPLIDGAAESIGAEIIDTDGLTPAQVAARLL